jgi:hypothetical protein
LRLTIETLQSSSRDSRDLQQLKIVEKLLQDEVERLKANEQKQEKNSSGNGKVCFEKKEE